MNAKQRKLQELVHKIFYQNPLWGGQYTMGPCMRECGNSARGSGVCADCLFSDLAKLCGGEYYTLRIEESIEETRQQAQELYDMLGDEDEP